MVFSFFKKLFTSSFLSGLDHAVKETMDDAKVRAEEIIDHAEERATKFAHNLVKGMILFSLALIGAIFALVGVAKYLTETVASLNNGLGYVLLGVVLIILAGFAKFMQKE